VKQYTAHICGLCILSGARQSTPSRGQLPFPQNFSARTTPQWDGLIISIQCRQHHHHQQQQQSSSSALWWVLRRDRSRNEMRMTRIRTAVSRENDRAIGEQTEAADKLVVTNGDTANSVLQEMSVGNTALATVGPSPYNDSTARIHSTHTQQRTTRRPPRHCCCSSHCPCAC